ncbi:ATP-binding protein [Methanocaldococcus indicus]|uniref:ATP-binding protein n=1 Tax=Methanocaldococcus indicus TaxID=213231 RepID=UPI003C6D286D
MAIGDEIIELIKNGVTKWKDILEILSKKYNEKSVIRGRKRLIDRGIVEMFEEDGEAYLRLKEEEKTISIFDQESFLINHGAAIKKYIKYKLSEDFRWGTFNIREFCYNFPMNMELNDAIIEYPFQVKELINQIYNEAYYEIYGDYPDKDIQIVNPIVDSKNIKDIGSKDIDKLVVFEGMIIQASKIKTRCIEAAFMCLRCGKVKKVKIGIWDDINKIGKGLICDNCQDKTDFEFIEKLSTFVNFQELLIQEPVEFSKDGRQHTITVFIEGQEGHYSGKVKITGVPIMKPSKKTSVSDIYVISLGIEELDKIEIKLTDEDIEKIKKVAKDRGVIQKLANAMFKEIKGYDIVKKAIFLQQVKGVSVDNYRGDIHILLITDPGIGKSTMMKKLEKFGAIYTSAVGSSDVGITASLSKEKTEFMESWVVKPGALVLADGGTCCIDEIAQNPSIYKALLEPMEQQTVSINKAGIIAKLPARCSILAACNPKKGRFDKDMPIAEQINLPPYLISRFDLIFPLIDEIKEEKDKDIYEYNLRWKKKVLLNDKKEFTIKGVKIDDEFIFKYIYYARQLRPIISEKAEKILVEYYVTMRKKGYEEFGVIPITMRQAESLTRLAEAIAKAKLKEVVDEEDAKEAIEIMDYCLRQIAYDPETGTLDIDKIAGTPKSMREKENKVLNIIKEICEPNGNMVLKDEIIWRALEVGISEEETERILNNLKKYGDIFEPRPGYIGIT